MGPAFRPQPTIVSARQHRHSDNSRIRAIDSTAVREKLVDSNESADNWSHQHKIASAVVNQNNFDYFEFHSSHPGLSWVYRVFCKMSLRIHCHRLNRSSTYLAFLSLAIVAGSAPVAIQSEGCDFPLGFSSPIRRPIARIDADLKVLRGHFISIS